MEISDLTEQEAWRYRVRSHNVSVVNAKDVYEQIGGCVNQLQLGADRRQRGRARRYIISSSAVHRCGTRLPELRPTRQRAMDYAWMGHCSHNHTNGATSNQEYYGLVQDDKRAQQLVMGKVFTLQPGRNMVSFDCKIAEIFAKKELQFRKDYFRCGHRDWLVR
ncbi:hypothetical protein Q9L58_005629 [Maublancomyces gigas]|uniref:Uncharacterized protein n=1 Tax=Discina gigas TaxID=1032678 RepID=A0ABR3GHK7_9PEZI